MTSWTDFYNSVDAIIRNEPSRQLYFRGHSDARWKLTPGIARVPPESLNFYEPGVRSLERALYYDFLSDGGDLIPPSNNSWDNLFLMQHHGVPTRILDWTESFAIALYFALQGESEGRAIWILNPYLLNNATVGRREILDVSDLAHGYEDYFLLSKQEFGGDVVALRPVKHSRRLSQQLAAFTLHSDLEHSLELLHPAFAHKVDIPSAAIPDAERFLALTGLSEFTLFPDLGGLARNLCRRYLVSA